MTPREAAQELVERLPQRPPFRFLTRIVELAEAEIVAEWDVDPAADFLRGHFPGHPVVPGVILIECALQAASALLAGEAAEGTVPVVTRVENARFKRRVRPGETVRCRARLTERLGPARWFEAALEVGGETAARLAFVVAAARAEGEA
jgi:3-hydroxyacyl-[acyl-carrier-protein] dehydratase